MSTENANPASAGSESTSDAISFNDAMSMNFEEADEANPSEAQEAASENDPPEPDEGEGQGSEQPEEEGSEPEDAEPKEPTAEADDALYTLPDGTQLTAKELKLGYQRDRDYRHKTQELASSRRDLEAKSNRVEGVLNALVDHLANRLPPEPSLDLARTHPGEYVQQKALFDAANAQLQTILQQGAEAKGVVQQLSAEQHHQLVQTENARLLERMPELRDPAKRTEFNQATLGAVQALGFSAEEFAANPDHRMIVAAHYARLGMEAEKAKQKAAQKVVNAPPVVAPPKRVERTQDAAYRANKDSMARLRKTGRIQDALKIDFE